MSGWARQLYNNLSWLLRGVNDFVLVIHNLDVPAWARLGCGTQLDREGSEVLEVGGDRRAGLSLPPVVVEEFSRELMLQPLQSFGVAALTCHIDALQI